MTVLYFAYGSCMSPDEIARDVVHYTVVGRAVLHGFRLGFTRYSRNRRGGVADLVPDLDAQVEGVLYRLPRSELSALDEREGAPDHYRRDFIAVRTVDGKIHDRVLTYVVARKATTDIAPHPDYATAVLVGAQKYLSDAYVQWMQTFIERLTKEQAQAEEKHRASASSRRTHRSRTPRRARSARS